MCSDMPILKYKQTALTFQIFLVYNIKLYHFIPIKGDSNTFIVICNKSEVIKFTIDIKCQIRMMLMTKYRK